MASGKMHIAGKTDCQGFYIWPAAASIKTKHTGLALSLADIKNTLQLPGMVRIIKYDVYLNSAMLIRLDIRIP